MPMIQASPQFTCDVCGQAVDASAVISYKLTLAIPGNGGPSTEAPQTFACGQAGHALQAATIALNALEAQRLAGGTHAQAT